MFGMIFLSRISPFRFCGYATQPVQILSKPPQRTLGLPPWAIHFALPADPANVYILHVALLIKSASVPALQVRINGGLGQFHLHPKFDFEQGDQTSLSNTIYPHADVVFAFPGSYLHRGENIITLQAVDQAAEQVPDAALTYDAIEPDSTAPAVFACNDLFPEFLRIPMES